MSATAEPSVVDVAAASDAALAKCIAGAAAGHASADEQELCRRFAPRVRLYGLRHLRDAEAAADLVQQVLMLTLQKLRGGEVREPERIASFILGTARRVASELRRGDRRAERLELDTEHGAIVPSYEPEPLVKEHLARCLDRLTERERSVMLLTYFLERSAEEIAADLALEGGHVRVIRHRALVRLRACLGFEPEASP